MSTRRVEAVGVGGPRPGNEVVAHVLPALRAALNGSGPALAPYAAAPNGPPNGPPHGRPDGSLLPASAAARPGEELAAGEDDPDDPTVAVLATSGSTGAAKGVLLQASALLASASAAHDRLGGPGHWLLALPLQHVAGLSVLVRSLVAGTVPVALDPGAGFDPGAFARAASRVRGPRRYTSLVPTQLLRVLEAGGEALEALAGFDAVLVGGAATPQALAARARESAVRLVTTYGMSETCGGCVYDGVPLDGVRVDVGPTGRIRVSGPVLARGYRGGMAGGFSVDADGTRWFGTDDAGRLDAPGTGDGGGPDGGGRPRLVVTGRLDDVVVTGGAKVVPAEVEAALLALAWVAEAVVVGVDDPEWGRRVVAAVVPVAGAVPDGALQLVRRHVATALAPHAAPRQLLVLPALPLRGPGKPDRAAVARRAAAGEGDLVPPRRPDVPPGP